MRIYKFSPSSDFAPFDTGSLFSFTGGPIAGKWFLLISRDALNVYAIRWTWWRKLESKIRQRLYKGRV